MAIRPVKSVKHIVDTATSAAAGAVATIILAQTVDSPSTANVEQVNVGSTINSIFLRVEVFATSTFSGVPRVYMAVMKNPGNNLPSINPSSVGDNDEKRFVIHQEMTMVGNGALGSFPRTMFKGVVRLPRGYRRMGVLDRLVLLVAHDAAETTGITNVCQQCIYKEYN